MPHPPDSPPGTNSVNFHRRQFFAERVGWVAMAVVLLWALVGGFGGGWLSHASTTNEARTLAIDYERFGRREGPVEFEVRLLEEAMTDEVVLHVNREFLDRVRLQRTMPAYRSMSIDSSGLRMTFDVAAAGDDRSIAIEYRPRRVGVLQISIRAGGAPVSFDQFVYP